MPDAPAIYSRHSWALYKKEENESVQMYIVNVNSVLNVRIIKLKNWNRLFQPFINQFCPFIKSLNMYLLRFIL